MKGTVEDRQKELGQLYPLWEKKTIWKFFEATALRFPENDFIVAQGREPVSYRQAEKEIRAVAKGLLAAGIRPGCHVAMQIENCPEQALVALALNAIRAVKVPVNISLSARELGFVLSQSESEFLVTGCTIKLNQGETGVKKIIALPGAQCDTDLPIIGWEDFLSAGEGFELPESDDEAYADEPSDIIYTSGSTKAPKGVVLTHDMLMRSAFASCMSRGFEQGRRVFVPLPMFHVYGYVEGMLAAILVGGAVLLKKGKFQAEPVLDFMEGSGANDILSVPSQMMALISSLKEHPRKLSALHAVYCSAAVCPAWVWPAIREHLGGSDLITGYGMTEVCGASMQTAPTDGDDILETRVGRLLPGGRSGLKEWDGHQISYRVVDQKTGEDCPVGTIGELWCKGLVVTKGYFNRPEANKRVLTVDGWFKTGDCGRFDENGYLILAGRVDDMYKINGENVSPKFLEDVMGNCPQISSAAVVGIPDEKHGYVGAAFIELYEDTTGNRQLAEEYCRAHLARFQVPKYFIYMKDQDWPRTSTGKVQKFRLKEMAVGAVQSSLVSV